MIGKIRLKQYKSYEDATLEFSPGINVITGDTGQGKTNILLALQLLKDNRPLGTGYIRRGQTNAEVTMEVVDDGVACSIVRRRSKSENSYDIEKDGKSILGGKPFTAFGQTPPKAVSEILNLSDINIQKQRDQHFLVYSPPGQIAAFTRSITRLDEIDQVTKLLKGRILVQKSEIAHHQSELKSTIVQLDILNDIDLELLGSMIRDAKDRIQKITRIKEKIARIEPIIIAIGTLEEQWITIPDDVDRIFEEMDSRQKSITTLSPRLSTLIALVDEIKEFEACKIVLPDGVDKLFEEVDSGWASIVILSSHIRVITNLIDEIQKIEVGRIVLPEDLEILSIGKDVSEKYITTCKKMEVLLEVLKGICLVESKISGNATQLELLRNEEKQLMEELSTCPECGTELTKESKAVLLCD